MTRVLILGNEKSMCSEYEIIEWITARDFTFQIIRFEEYLMDFHLAIQIEDEKIKNEIVPQDFNSVWFRHDDALDIDYQPFLIRESIKGNLTYNFKMLQKSFSFFSKRNLKVLSNYESFFLNKLIVLDEAQRVGLDIPPTLLCSSKNDLSVFVSKFGKVICKSAGENLTMFVNNNKQALKQYVEVIDESMLKDLPDKFFPTLFQQRIDKQMDIRIFYLDGKFFPMAIFSPCLDYREDYHNHRNVPIKLPADLEKKLHQLMQKLDLNTGSIDLVRCAKTKKYYFLEINPNGQFGMVSKPCNYYLEREIAEFLTS